jgi:O-antigen/teichoic acid export membrane protein
MSKQISVRRTGLVVFSARIGSIFTGLAFLLLMTRTLSTQQFGLWEVILDVVTFASYPSGLLVYWATRDIARGQMKGKTALGINFALSAVGIALYVVLSYFTAGRLQADWTTLLLAILLVPIGYWNQAANAIVSGYNPVVGGYAVISSEACKLLVALPALLVFHAGIDGVILALMAANLAQAATSTWLCSEALRLPFDLDTGKKWMTRSWLTSLTSIPYVVGIADTYVASLTRGGAAGTMLVGYYQAAFAVATLAGYSLYLAVALYPLLLRGGGSEELPSITLDLSLLFGIPMAVGAAALAKPILFVLKPAYVEGSTALMILAFAALATAVGSLLDQTLSGRVTVDADDSARFKHYLHSDLFFVFLVNFGSTVTYIVSVFLIVLAGKGQGTNFAPTLDLWAVAQVVVYAAFMVIRIPRAPVFPEVCRGLHNHGRIPRRGRRLPELHGAQLRVRGGSGCYRACRSGHLLRFRLRDGRRIPQAHEEAPEANHEVRRALRAFSSSEREAERESYHLTILALYSARAIGSLNKFTFSAIAAGSVESV